MIYFAMYILIFNFWQCEMINSQGSVQCPLCSMNCISKDAGAGAGAGAGAVCSVQCALCSVQCGACHR